ncbi:hypothetical protein [Evtepia sp.]|uniref:hypothetical protein n=1 Tax=Evtepia sp. TaxID=2773933 RepID=UPI003F18588B
MFIPPYTFPAPMAQDMFHRVERVLAQEAQQRAADRRTRHAQTLDNIVERFYDLQEDIRTYCLVDGVIFPFSDVTIGRSGIIVSYQNESGDRRKLSLTPKNLGKILSDKSEIPPDPPYENDPLIKNFISNLQTLLCQDDLSLWEKLLWQFRQEQMENDPTVVSMEGLLETSEYFDGHLIILPPHHEAGIQSIYPVQPCWAKYIQPDVFSPPSMLTLAETRALFAALKNEAMDLQKERLSFSFFATTEAELTSLDEFDLLFCTTTTACAVRYDREGNQFVSRRADVSYLHTQKYLPLVSSPLLANEPSHFLQSLFFFTGGNETAIDELSKLLANIAAPTPRKKQLSVIYTKHNCEAIRSFLYQAFDRKDFFPLNFTAIGTKRPSFLSSILQKKNLIGLLEAQVQGRLLLLLDDALPPPSRESIFRDLIRGKKITVPDKYDSTLSFHNHMHFVYVTDNETLSKTLVGKYHANLVDLSPYEQPWTGKDSLTPKEILWVQHNLFLHGCRCNHRPNPKKKPRKKATAPASNYVDQDIQDFLANQCRINSTLRCSRNELYDAYVSYCLRLYDKPPQESSIRFIKRVRSQLPKSVEYKVARCGPEKAPAACFVGLGIRKTPYTPASSPERPPDERSLHAFHTYLKEMESFADQLLRTPPLIKVHINKPDPNPSSRH